MRTPLYELCRARSGRMVPFAGWDMPMQFSGVIQEHKAVRNSVGMFDISHMGVLRLEGENPKDMLQQLVPSDLYRIGPGEAAYTVLLNERGGIRDDLIVYDLGAIDSERGALILVVNAACTESDTAWIRQHMEPAGLTVTDVKASGVLLALQGHQAIPLLEQLSGVSLSGLPRFGHRELHLKGLSHAIFTARTGYTGEDGAELLLSAEDGQRLWTQLLEKGVAPCGLGARDTLRLEAAMHLYGQDMSENTNPFEAGLGWLVHLEMPANFIGRQALEQIVKAGPNKRLVGLKLEGRAIARHNYPVLHDGKRVGVITSGTWSPTLERPIALASIPTALAKVGVTVKVEIRGKVEPAIVTRRPFYRCPRL
ncbi:glycine cleavage system aminomethyltransferase GcvT [Synechococcus sp. M16CYN]